VIQNYCLQQIQTNPIGFFHFSLKCFHKQAYDASSLKMKIPALPGLVWICGAGRIRTAVQTGNQYGFYMLILLLFVGVKLATGSPFNP